MSCVDDDRDASLDQVQFVQRAFDLAILILKHFAAQTAGGLAAAYFAEVVGAAVDAVGAVAVGAAAVGAAVGAAAAAAVAAVVQ